MKFRQILLLGYSKENLGTNEWKRLEKLSDKVVLISKDDSQLRNKLKITECLLVKLGETVDKELIDASPDLKYIGMLGTGYGRIDTQYAASRKIVVCNIAGYSTEGVAELAFGLILEHIREIARAKTQAQNGNYSEAGFKVFEIKNKNFGIIGLGRIGARIAEIAAYGFGAKVSYWSRNRKKKIESGEIIYQNIDDLLKNSDFISLNLAFNPETKNFLDSSKIQLIKPGAIVINLAPMELVDVDVLEKRLQKEDLTFILDHSDELTVEQVKQLSKYKNCIMYPPIGYITREATEAKLKMFVDNVENFLKGTPSNKVN